MSDTAKSEHLSPEEIEKLILDNLGLAYHLAKTWKDNTPKATGQDVESQAIMGLVKAANMYDPSKGGNFAAYASMAIRSHLGHLKYWNTIHQKTQPGELDAPMGGEDSDETTLHDKLPGGITDVTMSRAKAEQVIQDEIKKLKEPRRTLVRKWMAGNSYRDLQKGGGESFVMIGHHVKAGLAQIRKSLKAQGYEQVQDLWAECMELELDAQQIYENLVSAIEIGPGAADLMKKISC